MSVIMVDFVYYTMIHNLTSCMQFAHKQCVPSECFEQDAATLLLLQVIFVLLDKIVILLPLPQSRYM